ncbi:MAG: prepilin peptidase [Desulfurella sp.]|uniref:prepilin peptidase n=2 Tax=Desulfurella sp. TaxID=1962857 RepID=UPI003D0F86ED
MFVFLMGLIFGSFLNVCIYRIPRGISIITPPSSCPTCDTPIKWYDNIPLLSYIILKGKCRNCKSKISLKYPIIEIFGGLIALGVFLKFGLSLNTIFWIIFGYCLLVLSFIDLELFIIPDIINILLLVFGILFVIFNGKITEGLIGGVFGFILFYSVAKIFSKILKQEALGFGDVKLLGVIGVWLGWVGVVYTIFFASFIGSIVGILLVALFGKTFKAKIPFGPFLALSAFSYIFFGKELMHFLYGI